MRVLYVSHTAEVSGGEHSLLGLLAALPPSVQARVATPRGELQRALDALGVASVAITGTAGSLRMHPLRTPQAMVELWLSSMQLRRAARGHDAQLLHANSIRAGLIASLAPLRGVAKVVHVRDCLPPSAISRATMRAIAASATLIVANSRYTARSIRALAPNAAIEVVYNAVDLSRWDPASVDRARMRAQLGQAQQGRVVLAVVAQLSPWKGQDTAIEALGRLRDRGIDAHLLIVGSAKFVDAATRFDNRTYVASLHELTDRLRLGDRVSWLGERDDVAELMGAIDVLLLPSWEEPFGRSAIEAMAMGVPVVATSVGGPAEIIEQGTDGYLVPPREPQHWADAIGKLAADPKLRARMGDAGRAKAERQFSSERNLQAILEVYERALAKRPGRPRWRARPHCAGRREHS